MVAEKLAMDKPENNLTISTKLSTDQLICKSPRSVSPESEKFVQQIVPLKDEAPVKKRDVTSMGLYFGVLQILFGLLMAVFGVLVLVHNASLAQIGGGLWGGCLATLTGVLGVLSAARDCCPLKTSPQRIALTAFLALSLVSLAIAHLVLVLAAIGLARDANKSTQNPLGDKEQNEDVSTSDNLDEMLGGNQSCLFYGSCLVIVAACECVTAALSAWHCAKFLCPCFHPPGPSMSHNQSQLSAKDIFVSSWLGKHQQPVYVVHTNHRRSKKLGPIMAPLYSLPTPPPSILAPPIVGYPLIPAPLGPTPPPIIHPHAHHNSEKIHKKKRRYPNDNQLQQIHQVAKQSDKPKKQKKSREKQKTITEEEVAKTYTGLDRIIAEEFIEICDSMKTGSDSSGCTSSETTSNGEHL